jgi:Zn-dependent protease
MFRSYRVGTMFGFPIEVNLSFLFILGIILLTMGLVQGLVFVTIIFTSVLLHELGHALMARHLDVYIAGIELHFFGGAAKMTSQPKAANDEVAIAAAGPAVSFALGGLGLGLAAVSGWWILAYAGWINIILGAFNLVPALPMDGGRILRALLTRKYSFERSTYHAVTVARGFAILLGVFGIATGSFYLPVLAVLLWSMGSAELRMARMIGHAFTYDGKGYRFRGDNWHDSVEVLPADYVEPSSQRTPGGRSRSPFFSVHRPIPSSGYVIRQRNGRFYIEPLP